MHLSPLIHKIALFVAMIPLAGCIAENPSNDAGLTSAQYRLDDIYGLIGHYNLTLDPQASP